MGGLLEQTPHSGIQSLVRDLNRVYADVPALWENDFDAAGFWWLEANDAASSVVAFARASVDAEDILACVLNLTPLPRERYRIGLPRAGRWREALNTDADQYGGTNGGNWSSVEAEPIPWNGQPVSAEIFLPPLSALWLVPETQ